MKTSMIAPAVAAVIAFGTSFAAVPPAPSSAAQPASSSVSSAAPKAGTKTAVAKKAAPAKKTTATKADPINKPMPAKTAPTTSRSKNPEQQKKLSACAAANKGKTGDDYENSFSDCMKASPAADSKK
jgi:hypothetical protein